MKRYNFRRALAFLLTTLILAAACAPAPAPTPTYTAVPPTSTPTAKVMEATATPIATPTKAPPTFTPSPTHTPLPTEAISPVRRVISTKVEVGETVVHYRDKTFWDEAQFSWIMEHKADFKSEGIEKLEGVPSGYEGANYAVEFDDTEKSTSLTCEVHGCVSKRDSSFYGDFLWLVRGLGLDFIDDRFEETTEGLSWEGTIEGIPTEVLCEFPPQDVPYTAWADPIGHCHGHVWWTITE